MQQPRLHHTCNSRHGNPADLSLNLSTPTLMTRAPWSMHAHTLPCGRHRHMERRRQSVSPHTEDTNTNVADSARDMHTSICRAHISSWGGASMPDYLFLLEQPRHLGGWCQSLPRVARSLAPPAGSPAAGGRRFNQTHRADDRVSCLCVCCDDTAEHLATSQHVRVP